VARVRRPATQLKNPTGDRSPPWRDWPGASVMRRTLVTRPMWAQSSRPNSSARASYSSGPQSIGHRESMAALRWRDVQPDASRHRPRRAVETGSENKAPHALLSGREGQARGARWRCLGCSAVSKVRGNYPLRRGIEKEAAQGLSNLPLPLLVNASASCSLQSRACGRRLNSARERALCCRASVCVLATLYAVDRN
jgi:hypothetical protein